MNVSSLFYKQASLLKKRHINQKVQNKVYLYTLKKVKKSVMTIKEKAKMSVQKFSLCCTRDFYGRVPAILFSQLANIRTWMTLANVFCPNSIHYMREQVRTASSISCRNQSNTKEDKALIFIDMERDASKIPVHSLFWQSY